MVEAGDERQGLCCSIGDPDDGLRELEKRRCGFSPI